MSARSLAVIHSVGGLPPTENVADEVVQKQNLKAAPAAVSSFDNAQKLAKARMLAKKAGTKKNNDTGQKDEKASEHASLQQALALRTAFEKEKKVVAEKDALIKALHAVFFEEMPLDDIKPID